MATTNLSAFPDSATLACPNCHHKLVLYDPNGSEFCVCPSCYQYIDFESKNHFQKKEQISKVVVPPTILLGTTGVIKKHEFKVIAYLEKKEENTNYAWQEYILYNYQKGYATLAVFNGHWNFILDKNWEPILEKTSMEGRFATYDDFSYRLFNVYTPVVTTLIGEFDWDALNDRPQTKEYIAPPFMVICETGIIGNPNAQFYIGEYLKPAEVAEAFGLAPVIFPTQTGIGANQPSPYSKNFNKLAGNAILAFWVLLLFNFLIQLIKSEKTLLNNDYNIAMNRSPLDTLQAIPGSSDIIITEGNQSSGIAYDVNGPPNELKPFVTSSFEQTHNYAPIEITLGSEVDNSWLEATVALVNDQTNESWEVTKAVEYYHGKEDGENWSEGSQSETIILAEIPKGKYHLNIYPTAGDPNQTNMHITVKANFTLWRNVLLATLLISIYPLWCWWRIRNFEKRRWKNSDYSPYTD